MKTHLVYVVDDDADYLTLVSYVFATFLPQYALAVFADSKAMLIALQEDPVHPVLILLDFHMPVMNGRQTLRALKQQPDWKSIPVVIVTSSASDQEIHACYEAGVNSCLVKPVTLASMRTLFKQVCSYWVNANGGLPA